MSFARGVNRLLSPLGLRIVRTAYWDNVISARDKEGVTPKDRATSVVQAIVNREVDIVPAMIVLFKDLNVVAQLRAADSSVRWVHANADDVAPFRDRGSLIDKVATGVLIDGDVVEFGVYTGAVTRRLHPLLPKRLYHAFDAFLGVPKGMALSVGQDSFTLGGKIPDLPKDVIVHAGWFTDTIPEYLAKFGNPVALAYIDCDLYESVKTVLDGITGRLQVGSILIFDDWYNFPNWQEHSYRALNEMILGSTLKFRPIGWSTTDHAVAFQCFET
jgi:hypothetical protein